MLNNLSKTTKLFALLIGGVVLIMIILMAISGNKAPIQRATRFVKDTAAADNKVEALKTVSADLQAVNKKNSQLEKTVTQLQAQNTTALEKLKGSMATQVKAALQQLQQQNAKKQQALEKELSKRRSDNQYPINNASGNQPFVWVADLSTQPKQAATSASKPSTTAISGLTHSLLHMDNVNGKTKQQTSPVKPIYTIPVNATLTGASLMTPLVGRIPIDGKLPSPYHFKLVLSAKNLTANGVPLPGIKGAVASGIASGDLLGSCARGQLHSITFIFNDGTISTTQNTSDNNSLGYISTQTGNPCIPGTLHSDAALFLGAQVGFGAVQGYANSISDSQYMHSTNSDGETISSLIGDANKAAAGQALSSGAQAAQTWWNRRVQSSFDYVYVGNVALGHPMHVVVNITQQIPINYDPNARKVSYENSYQQLNKMLD